MTRTLTRTKRLPVTVALAAVLFIASESTSLAQGALVPGLRDAGVTRAQSVEEGPLRAAVRRVGEAPADRSALTPQTSQRSTWVARHPVLTGTLIGTGSGAILSRTRTFGGLNHDPRVMLAGAGIGAWGGLIADAVQKARAKEKVGIGQKIGIAAGAVAVIVLPLLACYGAGGCGGVS